MANSPSNGYYTIKFLLLLFRFLSKWLQKFIRAKIPRANRIDTISTFSWHLRGTEAAVITRCHWKVSSAFQGLYFIVFQFVTHGEQTTLRLPERVCLTTASPLSLIPNHDHWYTIEKPHLSTHRICMSTCWDIYIYTHTSTLLSLFISTYQ